MGRQFRNWMWPTRGRAGTLIVTSQGYPAALNR
jgi:hypothetical protein